MILRCSSQLRLAPLGGAVLGIDLAAALAVGSTAGYDTFALGELLPAAEAGLVAGLNARLADDAD